MTTSLVLQYAIAAHVRYPLMAVIDKQSKNWRINCKANKRGAVKEVLIRNYDDDDKLLKLSQGGCYAC